MQQAQATKLYVSGSGEWKLFAFYGGQLFAFPIPDKPGSVFSMGRPSDSSSPDIPLKHRAVSRRHGEFLVTDDRLIYRSLSRTNGSYFYGRCMEPESSVSLKDGDVIQIATATRSNPHDVVTLAVARENSSERVWNSLLLSDAVAEITVGRNDMLHLSSDAVSRKHASFFLAQQGWAIADHGSRNGVKHNGAPLGQPAYLAYGDCVNIAGYLFFFSDQELFYQSDPPTRRADDGMTVEVRKCRG